MRFKRQPAAEVSLRLTLPHPFPFDLPFVFAFSNRYKEKFPDRFSLSTQDLVLAPGLNPHEVFPSQGSDFSVRLAGSNEGDVVLSYRLLQFTWRQYAAPFAESQDPYPTFERLKENLKEAYELATSLVSPLQIQVVNMSYRSAAGNQDQFLRWFEVERLVGTVLDGEIRNSSLVWNNGTVDTRTDVERTLTGEFFVTNVAGKVIQLDEDPFQALDEVRCRLHEVFERQITEQANEDWGREP